VRDLFSPPFKVASSGSRPAVPGQGDGDVDVAVGWCLPAVITFRQIVAGVADWEATCLSSAESVSGRSGRRRVGCLPGDAMPGADRALLQAL